MKHAINRATTVAVLVLSAGVALAQNPPRRPPMQPAPHDSGAMPPGQQWQSGMGMRMQGPDRERLQQQIRERFAERVQMELGLNDQQMERLRQAGRINEDRHREMGRHEADLHRAVMAQLQPGVAANQDSLAESGPRTRHDVFTSVLKTSARGEIAAVTSQGRMLRLQVMDMPVLPPTSGTPNMAGGVPAKDFITLLKGESLVAFAPLDEVLAIGTAQGVVKRVQPDYPLNREDWEVIALKDKDTVVGVAP
ncbi:MAG: hypothetical protein Q7J79_06395, partial [Gemmatimonadales bacterium]|nr:hypothetical protein [Gemmatimonadales bacterium]